MMSLVTIATVLPVKNTLNFPFKWVSPDLFMSYKHLKGKLRVFLTGKTVAIVTSDVMKRTTTYSAMIGHLVDIIIVAATDKDL